jgi:hypothetical protein
MGKQTELGRLYLRWPLFADSAARKRGDFFIDSMRRRRWKRPGCTRSGHEPAPVRAAAQPHTDCVVPTPAGRDRAGPESQSGIGIGAFSRGPRPNSVSVLLSRGPRPNSVSACFPETGRDRRRCFFPGDRDRTRYRFLLRGLKWMCQSRRHDRPCGAYRYPVSLNQPLGLMQRLFFILFLLDSASRLLYF